MITLAEILRYLSILSPIFPVILLLTIKSKRTKIINILTSVVLVSFLSDIIGFIMVNNRLNNSAVSNTYFVIQFFLLMYFYSLQVSNKKLVYIAVILFTVFFTINTIFVQPFNTYQSWLRVAGAITFIGYSIGYYLQMLRTMPPVDPFHFYPFWINSGIYYYFSFNLFLFLITNYVFTHMSNEEIKAFRGFHNFNNIIKNLLFTAAVVAFKKRPSI